MKKGDKIYCVVDFGNIDHPLFEKDEYYNIDSIIPFHQISTHKSNIPCVIIHDPNGGIGITIFLTEKFGNSYCFSDYFITVKKLRELKLKQLEK